MPRTPIPVRVRDCACPHTPHDDGDVVYIRPTLSLDGGIAAQQDLLASRDEAGNVMEPVLVRRWLHTYVRYGACGWNLTDEDGLAVPFDVEAVLDDFELAGPVADAANDRYAEAVLRPLGLGRSSRTSPPGPTDVSISPTPASISMPPASQ